MFSRTASTSFFEVPRQAGQRWAAFVSGTTDKVPEQGRPTRLELAYVSADVAVTQHLRFGRMLMSRDK